MQPNIRGHSYAWTNGNEILPHRSTCNHEENRLSIVGFRFILKKE